MRDRTKIREALSRLSPEERAGLEASVLSELARTKTPIRSVVDTPNGKAEGFSHVVEIPAPAGYTGPRVIRLRRTSGVAGLPEEVRP